MSRRLIGIVLAMVTALAAAALLALGGGSGLAPGGQAAAQGSSVVETEVYARDARRFSDALFALGTSLQQVKSADDLAPRIAQARTRVQTLRARADAMRGYRLEHRVLERQRAALVRAATPVADAFDGVLDALESRDLVAVRRARAEARRALDDLSRAARGKGPAPRTDT